MRKAKFDLTEKQIEYIKSNWNTLSNGAMAKELNINFSTLSSKLHEMGLYRMHFEYWTPEQINFLRRNYKKIGDKELAILFNGLWEKEKRWSFKHIEKKRKYLNLKRTPEEVRKIKLRNTKRGCWKNMRTWDTRGASQIGDIRIWRWDKDHAYKVIKTDKGYLVYSRWMYEKNFGPIPPGHIVTFKDEDPMNVVPENLYTMPMAANARRNRTKYTDSIRQLEKTLKQFNQLIKQKS
jgi:hypothetical protein